MVFLADEDLSFRSVGDLSTGPLKSRGAVIEPGLLYVTNQGQAGANGAAFESRVGAEDASERNVADPDPWQSKEPYGMHWIVEVQHAVHKYFIWIIILSYLMAAVFPGVGLSIRSLGLPSIHLPGATVALNIPSIFLALLLFNAALGTKAREVTSLARNPGLLAAGLAGNLLAPLIFIVILSLSMRSWHNPDEVQQILTGLALIAAMPIAGASTAWSQNANGNLALSLGLILTTTLLSPILTPFVLHTIGFVTTGDYSEDLHELASGGASAFLGVWVILPSLLGLFAHWLIGERRAGLASPYVKLTNSAVLVVLNYSNAALSLPSVFSHPDADFLLLIVSIVGCLCVAMFSVGFSLAKIFNSDHSSTASMMFGLGMNNNGAGLVLASVSLADHPEVMLPIIIYNLLQHLIASVVDKALSRRIL
jgi:bile acid:Na+ symporter, BASS family